MSVHLSVRLKLKISVTVLPIGLNSSGNIATCPGVILSYFLSYNTKDLATWKT